MSNFDQNTRSGSKLNIPRPVWIGGAVVGGIAVLLLILTFTLFIPQGVISEGENLQNAANKAAPIAFAKMDNCVQKTARAAQVATAQTEALDKILKDAVSGRYGTGNALDQNKVFSLLQEAYPNTAGLDKTFENAMTVMTGCQDAFVHAQADMIEAANNLSNWRNNSWRTRTFGGDKFPNDHLRVVIGKNVHIGEDALNIMLRPIVETDTVNAVESGERSGSNSAGNNPFGNPTPTPTK